MHNLRKDVELRYRGRKRKEIKKYFNLIKMNKRKSRKYTKKWSGALILSVLVLIIVRKSYYLIKNKANFVIISFSEKKKQISKFNSN